MRQSWITLFAKSFGRQHRSGFTAVFNMALQIEVRQVQTNELFRNQLDLGDETWECDPKDEEESVDGYFEYMNQRARGDSSLSLTRTPLQSAFPVRTQRGLHAYSGRILRSLFPPEWKNGQTFLIPTISSSRKVTKWLKGVLQDGREVMKQTTQTPWLHTTMFHRCSVSCFLVLR